MQLVTNLFDVEPYVPGLNTRVSIIIMLVMRWGELKHITCLRPFNSRHSTSCDVSESISISTWHAGLIAELGLHRHYNIHKQKRAMKSTLVNK